MLCPSHDIPSTRLSPVGARLQQAREKHQVHTLDDSAELNIRIPKIDIDDDDQNVEGLQRIYERCYSQEESIREEEENKRREVERLREEENKKRQEEENKKREKERMIKRLDSELQTANKNPTSELPQRKRREKAILPVGDEYDEPCVGCKQREVPCLKQNPVQAACYECHKRKKGCSHVSTAKRSTRGANRGKLPLTENLAYNSVSEPEKNVLEIGRHLRFSLLSRLDMTGPPHNIPPTPLSPFEARVQWARDNRQVYTYDDSAELNVLIPEVDVDHDDEDIKDLQGIYEAYYQKKKERKRIREEEENRRREEERLREEERKRELKERMLLEKMTRKPDSALRTAEKNPPSTGLPQQKRRHDTIDNYEPSERPIKVPKIRTITTLWHEYDVPCDRCTQKRIPCHKQHPVRLSCYECRSGKQGCSFVSTTKIPRGANRRKTPSSPGSSEEDELDNHPTPVGPRRSARNLGSTDSSNETLAKIVIALESINTTIRDGFDNLQLALEKLGDRGDLTDNKESSTNHTNKCQDTLGSPAY
ncbi:hypothetical protein Clacol_010206 [Clathrus columnatus]|uniref:Zn(2)-C6 fungal-type domain-containing protein n=1 Tax=Clathrus columnatus TaxID=1419009 RepID=A0AAV5AQ87_9AGAM|nr:hypothetical protein Clacol_010206 [Clathrus columnatus]